MIDILLWFNAISVAIMAGVYFAFSTFVMRSLNEIDAPAGMVAMQSINRVIVKSLFLPIFFVSTLASVLLVILTLAEPSMPGARWSLGASGLYILGMFGVTLVGNVPLNNRLESADAHTPAGAELWAHDQARWTIWNHLRTIACTMSLVLLILAIDARP